MRKIIYYFIRFTLKPKQAIDEIIKDKTGWVIGLYLVLLYSGAYSATALIFYLLKHEPINTAFLKISLDKWYLYQSIYTLPVYMGAFLAYVSVYYLLSKLFNGKGSFDNTLATQAFIFHVPGIILMWIPETFLGSYLLLTKTKLIIPEWVEILRLFIIQFVWICVLSAIAINKIHKINWLNGLVVTVISLIPFMIIMAVFIR